MKGELCLCSALYCWRAVAVHCAVFLACFQNYYRGRRQIGLYIERCSWGEGGKDL